LSCGCGADPWLCRCQESAPLSAGDLDAWVGAARWLIERGYAPVLPARVLRALWRAGGSYRALAKRLQEAA